MNNLLETFRKIGHLSPENEHFLLDAIHELELPAKIILQEEGKVANAIYFIEEGIARSYYYKNGKDITHWIATEKEFVGSLASFVTRQPSNKLVETMSDCVLWVFEYDKLEELFSRNIELATVGRLFSNYGLALQEQRFDSVHFQTASERYDLLCAKSPEILQRISLGMIASFLGISQETLSRIRSKK